MKISTIQAALLFKVTTRTIQNWVREDEIAGENHLYQVKDLQKAYAKRHYKIPQLRKFY
jgi:hypothetical protein